MKIDPWVLLLKVYKATELLAGLLVLLVGFGLWLLFTPLWWIEAILIAVAVSAGLGRSSLFSALWDRRYAPVMAALWKKEAREIDARWAAQEQEALLRADSLRIDRAA